MSDIDAARIVRPTALLRLIDKNSVEYMELVDSIRCHGLFKPILVRPYKDGFQILDGVYRYTACCELGWDKIPATIKEATDDEALAITLQANAVKRETKPCEYAAHMRRILREQPELTITGLSKIVGKSPTWVRDCLQLSRLSSDLQKSVDRGEIPVQSAYLLAKLPQHQRNKFVDKAKALPAGEFKQIGRAAIRDWKEAVRYGRLQHNYPNEFTPRTWMRSLREVRNELQSPDAGVRLIFTEGCKTPLDGWKAAIKWMLHMDEASIEEQRRTHERRSRNEVITDHDSPS
jgi:ParB/RepB/Spo0J family partition protein